MKNILIISQARMGSTRLPGKVLKEISGKPLIWYLIKRIEQIKTPYKFIIATSLNENNKPLIEFAKELKIDYFEGNEDDVLDRYYQAAKKFIGDIIVRITSDCPLMEPDLVDRALNMFLNGNFDYLSNCHPYTYPDGYDIEIFSFEALEKAWNEAELPSEREHVTPYIWKNEKEQFMIGNFENDENLSGFRLTVDTPEDFLLISKIIEKFYDNWVNIRLRDVMGFLKENPDLLKINNQFKSNEGYLLSLEEDKKFLESKKK